MMTTKQSSQPQTVAYVIAAVLAVILGIRFVFFAIVSGLGFLLMFIPAVRTFMTQQLADAGMTSATEWEILLFWLIILIMLGSRFLMAYSLFKITDNSRRSSFFSTENVAQLKVILISYAVFALVQYIGVILNQFTHFSNVFFSNESLITNGLIWTIIYVAYLAFKSRVEAPSEEKGN